MVAAALCLALCAVAVMAPMAAAHGRMVEPPARNTMSEMDFDTPENYDESALFCGGLKVTHGVNGGKCGLCGDRFDLPTPRPHEAGGDFTSGVIVRTYQPGQVLDVTVEANHKGFFEFSLCERDDPSTPETEECFKRRRLLLADGTGKRFYLPQEDNGIYVVPVKIPDDVSCTHCVLRWHWRSANTWGCIWGCGPQEIYRNCADISVLKGAGVRGSAGFKPRPRVPPKPMKHPMEHSKPPKHHHG